MIDLILFLLIVGCAIALAVVALRQNKKIHQKTAEATYWSQQYRLKNEVVDKCKEELNKKTQDIATRKREIAALEAAIDRLERELKRCSFQKIKNKKAHVNANEHYYLIWKNGTPLMFTESQIKYAKDRAEKNPEDVK